MRPKKQQRSIKKKPRVTKKDKKQLLDFCNIRYRFNTILANLEAASNKIDELLVCTLEKNLTSLIHCLFRKKCQTDDGVLMNRMLKLEADLTIAGHLMHLNKSYLIHTESNEITPYEELDEILIEIGFFKDGCKDIPKNIMSLSEKLLR